MTQAEFPSSEVWTGIAAAPGLAAGPVVKWIGDQFEIPRFTPSDPESEWERVLKSLRKARDEILLLKDDVSRRLGESEAGIFQAHLLFLEDPSLLSRTRAGIAAGINAEASWMTAVNFFANQLAALPDPIFRERANDVRDVGGRVLAALLCRPPVPGLQLDRAAVIVAQDLAPSQTVALDKKQVLAICTAGGGPASHTAILAKTLRLPAIVGLGSRLLDLPDGIEVLVDGNLGRLTVNPAEEEAAQFRVQAQLAGQFNNQAQALAAQPAVSSDGHRIEVAANIGGKEDALAAVEFGADGVGLFRTEFLFLNRQALPTEDEQVAAYRAVFEVIGKRPLVVRALDIGGDKSVPYLDFHGEANPFLGWRGVRMIDERPDILQIQYRAFLRAAIGCDLRVMIPMVSLVDEVHRARRLFEDVRRDLINQAVPCANRVQFGIMVETPAAALLAEHLAPLVDFFSIGTNDLAQYTLAADRTNARVSALASPFHPAVLRLIAYTIQAAHASGKWVGLCGEFAGDARAVPVLLGLHLDEFSVSPSLVPVIKQVIRRLSRQACEKIAIHVLALPGVEPILTYLEKMELP